MNVKKLLRAHQVYLITSIIGLLFFCLTVLSVHYTRTYISDDTTQQVLLMQWQRGKHVDAVLPADNFVLHFPVYYLLAAVIKGPEHLLLATELTLNGLSFLLFVAAFYYFYKRYIGTPKLLYALLIGYIATLGGYFSTNLAIVNSRNLEFGTTFFILMVIDWLAAKGWLHTPVRNKFLLGGGVILLGLFIYSDPFFLITIWLPLTGILIYKVVTSKNIKLYIPVILLLILAVITYEAWNVLFSALLHIHSRSAPVSIISADRMYNNFVVWLVGVLEIFHANVFGKQIINTGFLVPAANLLFILTTGLCLYKWKRELKAEAVINWWPVIFAYSTAISTLAVIFTSYNHGLGTNRFMMFLPWFLVFYVAFIGKILHAKQRTVLAFLLTTLIIINFSIIAHTLLKGNRHYNASNLQIANVTGSLSLNKGYADYWSGPINTYFSHANTDFVQVRCVNNRLMPNTWLLEEGVLKEPATKTFYLYQPYTETSHNCPYNAVLRQFGKPNGLVHVNESNTLLIYDYDIVSKLEPARQILYE